MQLLYPSILVPKVRTVFSQHQESQPEHAQTNYFVFSANQISQT